MAMKKAKKAKKEFSVVISEGSETLFSYRSDELDEVLDAIVEEFDLVPSDEDEDDEEHDSSDDEDEEED